MNLKSHWFTDQNNRKMPIAVSTTYYYFGVNVSDAIGALIYHACHSRKDQIHTHSDCEQSDHVAFPMKWK